MAWNVSQGGKMPQRRKIVTSRAGVSPVRKTSAARYVIAAFALIVIGVAVWWIIAPKTETPKQQNAQQRKQTPPRVTRDAPSAKSSKPKVKEDETVWRTNRWGKVVKRKKQETYRDERGVLRYKNGNGRVPNPDDFKNPTRISTRGNMYEFKHPVENEIATLIMAQPGEFIVGEPDYAGIKRDFVNALLDKIEISEDDSEVDKELKQNVEEVKKDLAQRIKNGEDIEEILREARRELQQSARYKQHLDEIIQEQLYNPDISDADLAKAFEAANVMLKAKGIAPISEKRIMRARSRMLRAQERRAAESAAKDSSDVSSGN